MFKIPNCILVLAMPVGFKRLEQAIISVCIAFTFAIFFVALRLISNVLNIV